MGCSSWNGLYWSFMECNFRDSMGFSPIPIFCINFICYYCKMSKMVCPFLPVHLLFQLWGAMDVSKHTLFRIWYTENVPTNKFSAVETHVFDNIIPKNNFNGNHCREIKKVIMLDDLQKSSQNAPLNPNKQCFTTCEWNPLWGICSDHPR